MTIRGAYKVTNYNHVVGSFNPAGGDVHCSVGNNAIHMVLQKPGKP